jgi:hypothetical protein
MRRLILTLVWLVPGLAQANPIALEVVRARQVPGTHHVQITYGVDGTKVQTPLSTSRDGTKLGLAWHGQTGYTANTGSGLVSVNATQACDCDVPLGTHKYEVRFTSAMDGKETSLTVTVNVLANLPTPADAGVPAGDMMPWDIPEPSEIQGLNCTQTCKAAKSDGPVIDAGVPDAATTNPDVAITRPDAASTNPDAGTGGGNKEDDNGGCSLGQAGGPLSLSVFLLLLSLALWVRRRR